MAEPIYLVSGWMRSGTTMMMKCLDAGGIEVVRDPDNPDWELGRPNFELHRTPEVYEGKAVKSLRLGPSRARPWSGGYKVIHMRRYAREAQESYFKRYGSMPMLKVIEIQTQLSLELAYNRIDTTVLEVDYPTVVEDPLGQMRSIADFLEHPTWDPVKAAAVVDPELKHWTIEDMPGLEALDPLDAQADRIKMEVVNKTYG